MKTLNKQEIEQVAGGLAIRPIAPIPMPPAIWILRLIYGK